MLSRRFGCLLKSAVKSSSCRLVDSLRQRGAKDIGPLVKVVLNSPDVEHFNEKYLCLSMSLLVEHAAARVAIESLGKRILMLDNLSLQGCNQILGAFAKTSDRSMNFFCQKILSIFERKFLSTCPNRELSNVFWASKILKLDHADNLLAHVNWSSLDCTDLALIGAGLESNDDLWTNLRCELLIRTNFTRKDIPSIMCSLACAGINDRELILHLTSIIHRDELMSMKTCPAIVWAIATCDSVHEGISETAVNLLNNQKDRQIDPMDMRRVTRAFAVWGKLKRIEPYIESAIASSDYGVVNDSLLIWELVTNNMFRLAAKVFRSKSMDMWVKEVQTTSAKSQLYHIYLASLSQETLLSEREKNFLVENFQASFSSSIDDMSSSGLHRQASNALHALGIDHVSEYKDPVSGYVVDMYVPSLGLGIEVQGPTHFITDLETGATRLRAPDCFKHKILPMKIVQVTPWNFGPKLKGSNKAQMHRILVPFRQ